MQGPMLLARRSRISIGMVLISTIAGCGSDASNGPGMDAGAGGNAGGAGVGGRVGGAGMAGGGAGTAGSAGRAGSSGGAGTAGSAGGAGSAGSAGGAGAAGAAGAPPGSLFLGGFFPIGVFVPPPEDFDKWKGRGINTVVVVPQGQDAGEWDRAARDKGLRQIRAPLGDPSSDAGRTDLLAWSQRDEPDANGGGLMNLPGCQANYASWKAADPDRPVYINFGGSDVTERNPDVAMYQDLIATADWISNDLYPFAGYLNGQARRGDIALIGGPVDRLRGWSRGKPQFAYIETSNQGLFDGGRGVRPDELRAELWVLIVHGVRGFVYFPEFEGGTFVWDGTPPDVAGELTRQNALITQLAPVLQGPIDPPEIGATVQAPLEAAWRNAPEGKHFFVVNPTSMSVSATITLTGVDAAASATVLGEGRTLPLSQGALTDTFAPFAVHIYVMN